MLSGEIALKNDNYYLFFYEVVYHKTNYVTDYYLESHYSNNNNGCF